MKASTRLSDYDYDLPERFIAQHPAPQRHGSRLMVVDRGTRSFSHERFPDLLNHLRPGDVVVLNNTRVMPARLLGRRTSGGKVEVLLLGKEAGGAGWTCLVKPAGRIREGEVLEIENGIAHGRVIRKLGEGKLVVEFDRPDEELKRVGRMPLPPYIKRHANDGHVAEDRERYQTVFAEREGAIAAPTAGLHFTRDLLKGMEQAKIEVRYLTLHVGPGTFRPVRTEDVRQHVMEEEWYEIPPATSEAVNAAKAEGRRVIVVGTTTCRALEDAAESGRVRAGAGWARIYIYPPYRFQTADVLLTNFHLPRSSLILLVSAFAGRELILAAYEEAKRRNYRFYSYGDAMLIL